jgi:hypothetical protein
VIHDGMGAVGAAFDHSGQPVRSDALYDPWPVLHVLYVFDTFFLGA